VRPGLSTARLERLARALLVALAVAFVITLAAGSGSKTASGRVGGDYPAFYGAGTIVADGDGHDLYDISPGGAQDRSQRDLYGDEGGFLYYVYPPPVAAFYAPLAKLPYRLSYAVDTLLMVGALAGALALIRPMSRLVREHFVLAFAVALGVYPALKAVSSGQNTSITLLLLAAAWRAEHDDRDALGGVALGLLLLKPQLGAIVLALQLVRRRWRPVAVAAGVGAALFAVGVAVSGPGWVGDWWHVLRTYEHGDSLLNAHQSIAWFGAAESVFGVGSAAAKAIGYPLSVATVLVAAWVWWRAPDDDEHRALRYGVAAAAVLLASPHTVFYDAGLLVLPGVVLADRVRTDRGRQLLLVLWVLGLGNVVAEPLRVTPVLVAVAVTFVWCVRELEAMPGAARRRLPREGG
jgi:hypothetical protein